MRSALQGVDGNDALFSVDGVGVVVNTRNMTASTVSLEAEASSRFWVAPGADAPVTCWQEIAECAIPSFKGDVAVTAASNSGPRLYTVPKNVHRAASDALHERRFKRDNATAASRLAAFSVTARRQVPLDVVQNHARFFAANEAERGTLMWEMWGGDSGARWAQATLAKSGLTAAGDLEVNLLSFYDGDETTRTFFAQKASNDLRNDEVRALYRRTPEAGWEAWFQGDWQPAVDGDVPTTQVVELDDDTAVYVAGALYDAPDSLVSLRNFNPEEWDMAAAALDGVDWESVDRTMLKKVFSDLTMTAATDPNDNIYSPEERSQNASSQPRDANGRFISIGDQGAIKGTDITGQIESVDPKTAQVIVKSPDGQRYNIAPNEFEVGGTGSSLPKKSNLPPLNLDSILGQPRATDTTPKAFLKRLLPPMGPAQLKSVIDDYTKFIDQERQANSQKFDSGTGWGKSGLTKGEKKDISDRQKDLDEYNKKIKKANKKAENAVEDDAPPAPTHLTPETTDVKPLYLAIVDRGDPQAVTDLVAMIPAKDDSSETTAFRRVAGSWVEDAAILQDMRSPTPPPVVQLDEQMYQDVLQQVDDAPPVDPDAPPEEQQQQPAQQPAVVASVPEVIPMWGPNQQMLALIAEGGADRNRGNAERLRRYWVHGPGALKIMWNTPGDWTRCVRLLSKHLGQRAKGYCALRHKEATGHWTGDKENLQNYGLSGTRIFSSSEDLKPTRAIIASAVDDARVRSLHARVYGGDLGAPYDKPEEAGGGRRFRIPLLLPEGLESGDGRTFDVGSIGIRNLPLPLLWQTQTSEGHDGSFLVGRIDRIERTEDGLGNVTGVFDTGPWGTEAQRLVENKMLRWVSVDLDKFGAKQEMKKAPGEAEFGDDPDDDGVIESPKITVKKGRVMGATLVSKPAFQEVTIELEPEDELVELEDGMYTDDPQPMVASVGIAEAIPVEPPSTWFQRPVLNGPTPITVTDEGQVFGHIATWDVSHIGLPGATRAPRSASNYAYFHTGVVRCNDGKDQNVGQLTLAGGHADIMADAVTAVKHYDDTGSAIADVHAGEDGYGIWVAGALRPGTTPEQVRALRASAPSGDWRNINGRLELVACCQVNVPGFPVVRSQLTAGAVVSLVAAGAQQLARMQATSPREDLDSKARQLAEWESAKEKARVAAAIQRVRNPELTALAAAARTRVYNVLDVDGYLSEFKDFSPDKRDALAKSGHALKDGSFPIENVADLRRAVKAYGRTSEDKQAQVRRHIVKRARALGKPDMIPSNWSETALNDLALRRLEARELVASIRPAEFDAESPESEFNWVEKAGGLPPYIKRIEKHLREKGMDEGHAIATAVNAVKKACATGDLNFPGVQSENAGSRAEACKAVEEWERKKAAASNGSDA